MNYERKVLEKRWPPEKRRASMSFLLGYSRDARERKSLEDFAPERRLRCWVSQQSVLMMATFPFPGLSVRSSVSHSPFLFSLLSKRSVLFPPCAVVLYIVFLTPPKRTVLVKHSLQTPLFGLIKEGRRVQFKRHVSFLSHSSWDVACSTCLKYKFKKVNLLSFPFEISSILYFNLPFFFSLKINESFNKILN